jgi:ATP-dependent Clp protease ATP-binding subunit ClpX
MFGQRREDEEILRCSFCNRSQDQVDALIANPTEHFKRVQICNQCVEMCNAVLEDHRAQTTASSLRAFAH